MRIVNDKHVTSKCYCGHPTKRFHFRADGLHICLKCQRLFVLRRVPKKGKFFVRSEKRFILYSRNITNSALFA